VEEAAEAEPPEAAEEAEAPEAAEDETSDSLVSDETANASTESLAALATAIMKEPKSQNNVALGTGNTLEDLVKDMIRPMLKDWLDLNLAPMVKGVVKKEIARMVRRAEDD
jgi:cell pole-organizing protein PopZ